MIKKTKALIEKFTLIRYLIVGVTSFGVEFISFSAYIYLFYATPQVANILSIFTAFAVNFTLSNFWTFKSGKSGVAKKATKYTVLVVVNFFLNNAIFYFINTVLGIHPLISKVAVTALQTIWTFLAYKFWVFKK